jgi:hypothetical protein
LSGSISNDLLVVTFPALAAESFADEAVGLAAIPLEQTPPKRTPVVKNGRNNRTSFLEYADKAIT